MQGDKDTSNKETSIGSCHKLIELLGILYETRSIKTLYPISSAFLSNGRNDSAFASLPRVISRNI